MDEADGMLLRKPHNLRVVRDQHRQVRGEILEDLVAQCVDEILAKLRRRPDAGVGLERSRHHVARGHRQGEQQAVVKASALRGG